MIKPTHTDSAIQIFFAWGLEEPSQKPEKEQRWIITPIIWRRKLSFRELVLCLVHSGIQVLQIASSHYSTVTEGEADKRAKERSEASERCEMCEWTSHAREWNWRRVAKAVATKVSYHLVTECINSHKSTFPFTILALEEQIGFYLINPRGMNCPLSH